MYSSLVSKIMKAKRYAQERDRIAFREFHVAFRGENDLHDVSYREGTWSCTCNFFQSHDVCCHTMALEKILGEMLPTKQEGELPALVAQAE